MKKHFTYLVFLAVLAIGSRFWAPMPNFTAVIAVAFSGGMLFGKRPSSVLFPILIVFFSDLIINNTLYAQGSFTWFTQGAVWLYVAYALVAGLGIRGKQKPQFVNYAIGGLVGSLLFYLITNFGVWATGTMYPKDFSGIIASYTAGLPFLLNQVLGTLVYSSIIYAVFLALEPKLKLAKQKA